MVVGIDDSETEGRFVGVGEMLTILGDKGGSRAFVWRLGRLGEYTVVLGTPFGIAGECVGEGLELSSRGDGGGNLGPLEVARGLGLYVIEGAGDWMGEGVSM